MLIVLSRCVVTASAALGGMVDAEFVRYGAGDGSGGFRAAVSIADVDGLIVGEVVIEAGFVAAATVAAIVMVVVLRPVVGLVAL